METKDALHKAQSLCSRGEKCSFDIIKKLYDWKADRDDFDTIIESLIDDNYIDEERYAVAFVKDKFRFNKWGKTKITFALRQKNIPSRFINQAITSEISEEDYLQTLKNELEKKQKSIKETEKESIKIKLIRFASGKGFEYDIILRVIEEYDLS